MQRMEIIISANNQQANQAFAQTNTQMGSLEQLAVRVAASISTHFQTMAREIQQAIGMIQQSMGGLNMQAKQLVDQFGRPISSAASHAAPAYAGAASSPYSGPVPAFVFNKDTRSFQSVTEQQYRSGRLFDETIKQLTGMGATESQAIKLADQYVTAQEKIWKANEKSKNSMTDSMVSAVLFYEALQRGGQIIKTLTIDSALYAARVIQIQNALKSVAASNNISGATANALAQQIHAKGVTTEESYSSLTQMIAVGMNPAKAQPLAELAQNIGRTRGIPTAQVLQNLVTGAVTGRTEELHYMGIMVNAETEYRKLAASIGTTSDKLTEYQKKQALVNAILREGAGYAGTYSSSMNTLGGRLASLPRLVAEAKLALGKEFQPQLALGLGAAETGLKFTADHPGVVSQGMMHGGAIAGGLGMIFMPGGAGKTAAGLLFVSSTIALITSEVDRSKKAFDSLWSSINPSAPTKALQEVTSDLRKLNSERTKEFSSPSRMMMNDLGVALKERDFAKTHVADMSGLAGMTPKEMAEFALQQQIQGVQAETEWYKKEPDRLRQSKRTLYDAQTKGLEGAYAISARYTAMRQDMSLDQNGMSRELSPAVLANLRSAQGTEVHNEQLKMERDLRREIATEEANQLEGWDKQVALDKIAIDRLKEQGYDTAKLVSLTQSLTQAKQQSATEDAKRSARDSYEHTLVSEKSGYAQITAEMQLQNTLLQRKGTLSKEALDYIEQEADVRRRMLDRQNQDETDTLRANGSKATANVELERLNDVRELQLANVEQVNTYTIQAKLALEDRKYQIEVSYLQRITKQKMAIREMERDQELDDLNKKLWRDEINQSQYNDRRQILNQQAAADEQRLQEVGAAQLNSLAKNTIKAKRDMIQAEYTKLFDRLKSSAEGVFDAMLTKSQSVWSAMANAFKTAFLTVVKEIVSSQIARSLTSLLTGQNVQLSPGGGNTYKGPFGAIARFLGGIGLGAVPVFGGGQMPGGGGATPPFIPNGGGDQTSTAQQIINTATGGRGGGGGIFSGNFTGLFGSYQQDMSKVTAVPGMVGVGVNEKGQMVNLMTGQIATKMLAKQAAFFGKFGKAGGAVQSGLFTVGAMLGMDGLMRGGWGGTAESTMGGAMIGTAFLPGIGTAIGAGVGFLAGVGRMLFGGKSETDKMKERIKALTGVDVREKNILKQAVEMAKSQFAGNYDLFIRSRQGQDLIELYAQSTGQKFVSKFNTSQLSLVGAGGSIYEAPAYLNGTAMNPLTNLPGLNLGMDQISAGVSSGPTIINFTMPADAVNDAFNGRTVQAIVDNPRAVQSASLSAQQGSYGRTQAAITTMSPSSIRS